MTRWHDNPRRAARLSGFAALALLGLSLSACDPGEIASPGAAGTDPRPDLLLVVVDTWRWDGFGANGANARDVTPRLDAAAARGVVFTRAFAPSPWTLPSVASLLTGQYPSIHGAWGHYRDVAPIRTDQLTLAQHLRRAGYHTTAVANAPFLAPGLGFRRGFDRYDYVGQPSDRVRRAGRSVEIAEAGLTPDDPRPAFLFLHVFDPHLDYDPPPSTRGLWSGAYAGSLTAPFSDFRLLRSGAFAPSPPDADFLRALYEEELRAVDAALGDFLARSAARRPGRPRWVIVTADHGEAFGEHGGWEHGHTMHAEQLQVPLLVLPPEGALAAPRVNAQVRTLDVPPTLLELAGVAVPGDFPGESLLPLMAPPADAGETPAHRPAFGEREHLGRPAVALRDGRFALIRHLDDGSQLLYDQVADPRELRDLAAERPEEVARLARELDALRTGLGKPIDAAARAADLDPALRAQLESLGYLTGAPQAP